MSLMRGGLGFFGLLLAQHKFNLCSRLKCNGEDAGRGVLAQEKRRRYRPDQKSTPRVFDPSYDVPELFKGTAKLVEDRQQSQGLKSIGHTLPQATDALRG